MSKIIPRSLPRTPFHKNPLHSPPPPPPPPHPDAAILARFRHKDWLTPKQATTLANSLTKPSSALTLLSLYSSRPDYNPTESFSISILTSLSRANLPHHALQSFLESLNLSTFSDAFFFHLIKAYAHSFNRIDKAVETLFAMPKKFNLLPSIKTFNLVLNVLVNSKLFEVAHEVYVAAPRLGVEVDACCLNILIKGLCGCGKLEAAFKVFDEFPKLGIESNVRTFATLMHGLCEEGDVEGAFGLLEIMETSGVGADVVVFNVLIGGLRKKGRVDEGKRVLERVMKEKGCVPNGGSYQEVVYGLIDAGRFVEAKEVMERMVLEGFRPSFVSYRELFKGICKMGMVKEVDWALKQMVRQGFVPKMGMWRQIVRCVVSQDGSSICASFDGVLEG